jgi:diadenosine tetraphosphate (Ap4A) HIT family hydrolase
MRTFIQDVISPMTMVLDPRLETDSTFIHQLKLCQVRLSHNAAFPWILLIPNRENIDEVMELSPSDQRVLMEEIVLASQAMKDLFHPTKLNIANLGNVVPQLHVHVVARYDRDPAWPGPIWNSGIHEDYTPQALAERLTLLKEFFVSHPKKQK